MAYTFGACKLSVYELMNKKNMVHGFPNVGLSNEVCTGCLKSKQVRKSFQQKSSFSATQALQLVYGDLCGPIDPITPGGNKYFFSVG